VGGHYQATQLHLLWQKSHGGSIEETATQGNQTYSHILVLLPWQWAIVL
jgi:hypothetical protein